MCSEASFFILALVQSTECANDKRPQDELRAALRKTPIRGVRLAESNTPTNTLAFQNKRGFPGILPTSRMDVTAHVVRCLKFILDQVAVRGRVVKSILKECRADAIRFASLRQQVSCASAEIEPSRF
jgi:hypothetical protein